MTPEEWQRRALEVEAEGLEVNVVGRHPKPGFGEPLVKVREAVINVKIVPEKAGEDPEIEIYHVELSDSKGIWTETFGSKEHLDAFMKGLRAASGMTGFRLVIVEGKAVDAE